FEDPDVTHVEGGVDAARDIETINTELILADLQTLERALPRLAKEAKTNARDKDKQAVLAAAETAREVLDGGRTLFAGAEESRLRELNLLTVKPFVYVFDVALEEFADEALRAKLSGLVAPAEAIFLDAKIEAELTELDDAEAAELVESMGQTESGLAQLARVG